MWTLLMIALGIVIGWQLPQPEIAKKAQAWVVQKMRDAVGLN